MSETPKSTISPRPRANRFAAGLPAWIRGGTGEGDARPCRLVNLSRSGALLERAPWLPEGHAMDLGFESSNGDLHCRLFARVARSAGTGDDLHLGVAFTAVSDEQGHHLEALLSRLMEGRELGALAELTGDEEPARVREVLASVPVTHRAALALRAGPDERRLLAHDTDPIVQTALVRNPNLLLDEITFLLAKPTLATPALDFVARDPRWRGREDLRIRLASHPRVSLPTARRVAAALSPPARKRLLRRPALHPGVRAMLLRD